jgi:hypothetical protein
MPLDQKQGHDDDDEADGELRGRQPVTHAEPGAIDRGREGIDAEILDRAEIGERFHQRERDAGDDRRARQRERHAAEGRERAMAEHARGVDRAGRLLEERRARENVDVGIEHERQHETHAPERMNLGEPVVAATPAEPFAQTGLHRARESEAVRVGVADDVGRHGEGQEQRPLELARAREAVGDDEPGGESADQHRAEPHQHDEHGGVREHARQHGLGEMREHVRRWPQDARRDRDERQRNDERRREPHRERRAGKAGLGRQRHPARSMILSAWALLRANTPALS